MRGRRKVLQILWTARKTKKWTLDPIEFEVLEVKTTNLRCDSLVPLTESAYYLQQSFSLRFRIRTSHSLPFLSFFKVQKEP